MRAARLWILVLLIAICAAASLSACAPSPEKRCKQSGGVWRGTFCEMPGR